MMGEVCNAVSIEKILGAVGCTYVRTVDPLNLSAAESAVREAADMKGVRAIIMKSPCIAVCKPQELYSVDAGKCINCKKCIRELGCPAIVLSEGRPAIESSLCYGCGVCAQVCPAGAIGR